MLRSLNTPMSLTVTLAAAALLMVTMGTRQSFGLFIAPIDADTGLGIAGLSLALAVGQLMWGVAQPLSGALADHYGARPVLLGGLLLLAAGCALTPFMSSTVGVSITLGLLAAIGSGAGSFSVLIGATASRVPLEARATASGVINAGGSFGQFIFAPILQKLILAFGWMNSLWAMAAIALAALPLVSRVATPVTAHDAPHTATTSPGLWLSVKAALKDPSYLLLHAGFFTCGFHIAFLVTHLPGEVGLCGLPPTVAGWSLAIIGLFNIAGSLYAGAGVARYRSKHLLFWLYASRAAMIALYLAAPRSDLTFYLFAAGLGFTWLATVPPTAAIVGKLFGPRYLGTLFGLTLFTHQIGGFLGAWLGGQAITRFGDYTWMWYADIVLAGLAALVNLPIREAPIRRAALGSI